MRYGCYRDVMWKQDGVKMGMGPNQPGLSNGCFDCGCFVGSVFGRSIFNIGIQ